MTVEVAMAAAEKAVEVTMVATLATRMTAESAERDIYRKSCRPKLFIEGQHQIRQTPFRTYKTSQVFQ